MRRHIVLIGLPGSGKTAVGRLVAERLGAPFVDIDVLIVRRMQMPVTRVFGEFGEAKFREIERETVTNALAGSPSVICPGGGWAAQPGQLEAAKASSFVIYLRTLAMTAAKRAGDEAGRPLLGSEDVAERMRHLLHEREPFYLQADAEVKTDTQPIDRLAVEIVALAQARAGWHG